MTPYRVRDIIYNTGNNHNILHRRSSAMVTAGDGADDLTVVRCVSDRTVARSPPDRIAACVQCAPRRKRRTAAPWVGRNVWLMDGVDWWVEGCEGVVRITRQRCARAAIVRQRPWAGNALYFKPMSAANSTIFCCL